MMEGRLDVSMDINEETIIKRLRMVLFRVMKRVEELSSRKAPVDTGRLKNSIQLSPKTPGHDDYIVADGVHYGIHQEFGTITHPAQPFFRPSLQQAESVYLPLYLEQEFRKENL